MGGPTGKKVAKPQPPACKPAPSVQSLATPHLSSSMSSASQRQAPSIVSNAKSAVKPTIPSRRGGFDGADDEPAFNKRLDLPYAGVQNATGVTTGSVPSRPAPSKLGQPAKVALNVYAVDTFPTDQKKIYQFDVDFRSENVPGMKRGLMMKLWHSAAVQQKLGDFLWDGNKLAWSLSEMRNSQVIKVDLDAEENRTPKPGKEGKNVHSVHIRQTKALGLQSLQAHLAGTGPFDENVLQALNFFDHLLRETPSRTLYQHKRSFFHRGNNWKALGNGVEAWKGVYQAIRIGHILRGQSHGARLVVNADVANGMFFEANRLHLTAVAITGARDVNDLSAQIERSGDRGFHGKALRRLRKVRVLANHRGNNTIDEYVIDSIIFADAKQHKIEVTNPDGSKKWTTVYDYFSNRYNVRLQYPKLPLIKNNKGAVLPMEVLKIKDNQRYPFKLDERQTSQMITFAATPPADRLGSIQNGLQMLNWSQDPLLAKYGVRINPNKTVVEARILAPPTVKYGAGEAKPGTSGRWDLKGKKFLASNPVALKSWSVCVVAGTRGKPDKSVVDHFVKTFVQSYVQYGGKVENKAPALCLGSVNDIGKAVTEAWNAAGKQANSRPQMLVFILPDKNSAVYGRLKRSADCRYGVVSQCMQYAHVQKAQPQYIANVLMKFNAKLGGITCRAVGQKSSGPNGMLTRPTIILGADVSHAAPGTQAASMAALTCSQDPLATRYMAACESNGFRVEMIDGNSINKMLKPMVASWLRVNNNGKLPDRVFYFRDGVAEGQYPQVLQYEIPDLKKVFQSFGPTGANVKFVVVVGGKRHHVRFFPEKGDRNGNPLPGTLVETGVTNPYENDFYLCSHAAIKGTARPMHYHVLMNEAGIGNDELQTLIYEHSYQYIRATTPVSQHPAIYYAHLASNRAIPHDPQWQDSSDVVNAKKKEQSSGPPTQIDPLMPMPNEGGIQTSMWYI